MDGMHDRSSGRMAENWSRTDSLRTVSAAPSTKRRAAFAASPAADVIIDLTPLLPEPVATTPLQPVAEISVEAPRLARRKPRGVVLLSVGAIAAVGIMGAVLLRPDVETGPAPGTAVAAVASPAAVVTTIHLRVSAALSSGARQRIEAALAAAGYDTVVIHEMPFGISRSRVGYFREADRAAAEALITALQGTVDGVELRDYRSLMETPEPGRLDLWIRS